MSKIYDVAVIGAGPGGYVAGIRAAQLGLSACVIEKDTPGGVCLNWGCIPSKSLIHHAAEFGALREMEAFGIRVDRSGFRYGEVHARSRSAARTLAGGVAALLRKNEVEVIKGTGSIAGIGKLALAGAEGVGIAYRPGTSSSRPDRGRCCCRASRSTKSSSCRRRACCPWIACRKS